MDIQVPDDCLFIHSWRMSLHFPPSWNSQMKEQILHDDQVVEQIQKIIQRLQTANFEYKLQRVMSHQTSIEICRQVRQVQELYNQEMPSWFARLKDAIKQQLRHQIQEHFRQHQDTLTELADDISRKLIMS